MKSRLKYLILGGLVIVLGAVLVKVRLAQEPTYQGKTVTQWIQDGATKNYIFWGNSSSPSNTFVLTGTNIGGTNFFQASLSSPGWFLGRPGRMISLSSNLLYTEKELIDALTATSNSAFNFGPSDTSLAVKRMGPAAVPALISALGKQDGFVSQWHKRLWFKAPLWVQTQYLAAPFPAVQIRRSASRLLREVGTIAAPAVPALVRALEDTDPEVRSNALAALTGLGRHAHEATPALVARLNKVSEGERRHLVLALDRVCDDRPALLGLLSRGPVPISDLSNVDAIMSQELHGAMIWVLLTTAMQHPDNHQLRQLLPYLLTTVERDGPAAADLVPLIVPFLTSPEYVLRYRAVNSLCAIGTAAKIALPALEELRHDENMMVRRSSQVAVEKISGKEFSDQN